jgi:hypothetical protein
MRVYISRATCIGMWPSAGLHSNTDSQIFLNTLAPKEQQEKQTDAIFASLRPSQCSFTEIYILFRKAELL